MSHSLEPFVQFMEKNLNVLHPVTSKTSYFEKLPQLYSHWGHQVDVAQDQLSFLSAKTAFGEAMGPLALFALFFYEYRRVVCADQGGHAYYFEDGRASGDGRGRDYAHDPGFSQHRKMIQLFEGLNLITLPSGAEVLQLMKDFQPRVAQDHSIGGKYFLIEKSKNELAGLDPLAIVFLPLFADSLELHLRSQWGEPTSLVDRVAGENPEEYEIPFGQAWHLMNFSADYTRALPQFEALQAKFPNDIALHKARITCCKALRKPDELIQVLLSMTKLTPYSMKPFVNLAVLYEDANRLEEAASFMKQALELMYLPDFVIEYVELLKKLGRWSEILNETKRALTITETMEPHFQNRILAFTQLGKVDEAKAFIASVKSYTDAQGWRLEP